MVPGGGTGGLRLTGGSRGGGVSGRLAGGPVAVEARRCRLELSIKGPPPSPLWGYAHLPALECMCLCVCVSDFIIITPVCVCVCECLLLSNECVVIVCV